MIRTWQSLALAVVGLAAVSVPSAQAQSQVRVQGAKTVVVTPGATVARETLLVRKRRPWRERNPYFVARPTSTPAVPGERARVTFEPFSALYYPTTESYYPPIPPTTVVAPR